MLIILLLIVKYVFVLFVHEKNYLKFFFNFSTQIIMFLNQN